MKHLTILAALSLVAGCAGRVPPPAIEVRTQTVEVPVSVSCVAQSDIPVEPPLVGSELNGHAQHDLDIVAASAKALRQALREARALLTGCVKQ